MPCWRKSTGRFIVNFKATVLFSILLVTGTLASPVPATAQRSTTSTTHRLIERSSRVLIWLDNHPRPGTPTSRSKLRNAHLQRIVRGLKYMGVYHGLQCIHRYEGAWNDPNPPFWGGLQMDWGFYHTYGKSFLRWGSPNRWPVWAQLIAGYRATLGRGFSPWPNTARYCGLL